MTARPETPLPLSTWTVTCPSLISVGSLPRKMSRVGAAAAWSSSSTDAPAFVV